MDIEAASRLRTVIARLARDLNATATSQGLTPTQLSILALVSGQGPIGLAELTRREGLHPSLVSRTVSALLRRGMVQRTPDPADHRTALISSTGAGDETYRKVREDRAVIISRCLAGMPAAAQARVVAALADLEQLSLEVRAAASGARLAG
jgi:DNA-binding MarR family transcriptional regulator